MAAFQQYCASDANFFEPGDAKANQFWLVNDGEEKLSTKPS